MKIIRKLLKTLRGEQNIEKLKKRGLKMGNNVTLMGECIIDPSHCWHIEIGDDVIIAPRVHILAHDAGTKLFLGHTRVANVIIGNKVFIGAGTIILPGVTIGNNVVIGAGSIVSKDIPDNSVAVGSPVKVVSTLEDFLNKQKQKMSPQNTFDALYTLRNKDFSEIMKMEMLTSCQRFGELFVE